MNKSKVLKALCLSAFALGVSANGHAYESFGFEERVPDGEFYARVTKENPAQKGDFSLSVWEGTYVNDLFPNRLNEARQGTPEDELCESNSAAKFHPTSNDSSCYNISLVSQRFKLTNTRSQTFTLCQFDIAPRYDNKNLGDLKIEAINATGEKTTVVYDRDDLEYTEGGATSYSSLVLKNNTDIEGGWGSDYTEIVITIDDDSGEIPALAHFDNIIVSTNLSSCP